MKRALIALVVGALLVAPLGGQRTIPGESIKRCAAENFASAEITNEPTALSKAWVHKQYCTQVAVELAKQFVIENPSLAQ